MKIIEDSNATIIQVGEKFMIIDITTNKLHAECDVDTFDSYEKAVEYMNKEIYY